MNQNLSLINDTRNSSLVIPEKQKKSLITFAKINKYFLIPFLTPVFCMLANYFLNKIREIKLVRNEEFILSSYIMLSYIAAGCFYFISKFRQKVEEQKENIIYREANPSSIQYIYNEGMKTNLLKEWILIIFVAFLSVLFEIFSVFSAKPRYHIFQERLYFILFIPLFSKLILKENLFRHHYLSLLIAISGFILLFIPVCLKINVEDIVPNVINFLGAVCYSLFLVLIKHLIYAYMISPFKLCFIFGSIGLGFIFFGYLFYTLIKYHDFTYFKESLDFSYVDNKLALSLYLIATLIFATILQFFTLLVIFYFSPILLMVTDIISPLFFWVAVTIEYPVTREYPKIILEPIGYVIVLFASLIYNEIIIFNFCGLNKDTKIFIEERLYKESKDLLKTENDLKYGNLDKSEVETSSVEEDKNSRSS